MGRWVAAGALALGLMSGVLVGCDVSGECSPANCNGCCDADGFCEPGNLEQACGMAANACSVCGLNAQCDRGVCMHDGIPERVGSLPLNGADAGTP